MTKRTDIHRPSVIDPVQYEFVCAFTNDMDMYAAMENAFQRQVFNQHRERTGGRFSGHDHGGSCHVCGAHALNLATFYHRDSNSYIQTGFDCAEKMDAGDPVLFRKIKDERTAFLHARAGKMKALGTLEERGLLEQADILFGQYLKPRENSGRDQWEIPNTIPDWLADRVSRDFEIASDIMRKLVQYGDLSEKQWKFFAVLLNRILTVEERAQKIEERKAMEPRIPAPEGRTTTQGIVVSKKWTENAFVACYKMVVKDPRGYAVWLTVPRSLEDDVEVGDVVKFDAKLTRSDRDESFAFGSRPTKASIVQKKEG